MDPFSPPASDGTALRAPSTAELAPHSLRLSGYIVDRVLLFAWLIPAVISMVLFPGEVNALGEEEPSAISLVVTGIGVLGMFGLSIYNWVLIDRQGQTLGKMFVGTRIVKLDGSPVDLVSGVILRNWVLGLITGVLNQCCLGWVMGLADVLFIFGAERRCLHDYIAGTIVVVAD